MKYVEGCRQQRSITLKNLLGYIMAFRKVEFYYIRSDNELFPATDATQWAIS